MDPAILSIFVIGVIVTIVLPPLLVSRSARRKEIEQLESQELIAKNINAGEIKGKLRLLAYILPLPAIIMVRAYSKPETQNLTLSLVFIVIFACLSTSQFFGEIEKLTTAEMEKRKAGDNKPAPDIKKS